MAARRDSRRVCRLREGSKCELVRAAEWFRPGGSGQAWTSPGETGTRARRPPQWLLAPPHPRQS